VGFENFGIVSFTTQGKASDFVGYLEKGKVMATRCLRCGSSYFPRGWIARNARAVRWSGLRLKGTVD
jgi:uncharacterized OB-fold protein